MSIIQKDNQKEFDSTAFKSADVAIEFSTPTSAYANLKACFERCIPVVCGTTAWLDKLEDIQQLCPEHQGCFLYASNFSLGVNLFFELNRKLAQLMEGHEDYKASLEEIHHTQKLDAPSGTAIHLAADLVKHHAGYEAYKLVEQENSSNVTLPIKALRIDDVPGTHTVTYESNVDKLSIRHEAFSRNGFALGATIAAEFIVGKKGVFSMKDVLA